MPGDGHICGTCGEFRPVDDFYQVLDSRRGRRYRDWSRCRSCATERARNLDPARKKYTRRWSNIKRYYGLTRREWFEILEKQCWCCAICGRDYPEDDEEDIFAYNWHTDHDHKTNVIRGILCPYCNSMIGFLEKSSHPGFTLHRLGEYLGLEGSEF